VKQVNDFQEKNSIFSLVEKYQCQLMDRQQGIKDNFFVALFNEKRMEEERTGIKREVKVKGRYDF
jgi:hypothetical protein